MNNSEENAVHKTLNKTINILEMMSYSIDGKMKHEPFCFHLSKILML